MENTKQYKSYPGDITQTAKIIEKIHRCSDCPIRKMAIKNTKSIFARLHNWHKTWWPGWKAHQTRACAFAAGTGAHD